MKKFAFFVVLFLIPASATFCQDSANDLGSEYLDSGIDYDTPPNIERIRDYTDRDSLYTLSTNVGLSSHGCSEIIREEQLWRRNPGHSVSSYPHGIYATLDGSEFTYSYDWFSYFWDDDTEEICYLREHERETFFNCIDASQYAADIALCDQFALWNVTSNSILQIFEENAGIVLVKEKAESGVTNGYWTALYLWDWKPKGFMVDISSSAFKSSEKTIYAYDNTSHYSSYWVGGNPKEIFSFETRGESAFFDFTYNETDPAYMANGTERDAHKKIRMVNYKAYIDADAVVEYAEPETESNICANNEYECDFFENHLDYTTFSCTDEAYEKKTYPFENISRIHADSLNVSAKDKWLDTTSDDYHQESNISFFRQWTARPELRRLYTSSSPSGSESDCSGIYTASHGYRIEELHESVFTFFDPETDEVCIFKQDRVTDGTNTSNETVWIEFKCAQADATINGSCEDGESAALYGDNAYFYAYTDSFMIAGFNNRDYGDEYGGFVLVELLNSTYLYYTATHTSQSGGVFSLKNATDSFGFSLENVISEPVELARATAYKTQFGTWQSSDILGSPSQYWDYDYPLPWVAFNVTMMGEGVNASLCQTPYASGLTNASGFLNLSIDHYERNVSFNCSSGMHIISGVATINKTNNVSMKVFDLEVYNISVLPEDLFENDSIRITASLRNNVNITVNSSASFTLNGALRESRDVLFSPGEEIELVFNWTATLGYHTIAVEIDPLGEIPEINESNNEVSLNVLVNPSYLYGYISVDGRRLSDLKLELSWDGGTATTKTNINGRYEFRENQISGGLNKWGKLTTFFTDEEFIEITDYSINPNIIASGFTHFNITPSRQDKSIWVSNHSKSNGWIYYYTKEAAHYFHDELGFVDDDPTPNQEGEFDHELPLEVRTHIGNTASHVFEYTSKGSTIDYGDCWIVLSEEYSNFNHDPDVYRHELAHHIMFDLCEEYPSFNDSMCPGDEINHEGDNNPNTCDGFIEGVAEFLPCMMTEDMLYLDENIEVNWNHAVDYNHYSAHRYNGRVGQELAIAGILWDLYDDEIGELESVDWNSDGKYDGVGEIDSFEDNVSLSQDQIWGVLNTCNIYNTRTIYTTFLDSGLVNKENLDAIFEAHGWDPDLLNW